MSNNYSDSLVSNIWRLEDIMNINLSISKVKIMPMWISVL